MSFPSPLGVAAGMDKRATWFKGLDALGFGFVEVGTFTAEPQKPNPGPTDRRLVDDRALWNRSGFPNPGARKGARRISRRPKGMIVAANVGKSRCTALADAADDYRASVRLVAPHADFVVINVSSPNTEQLRSLQAVGRLEEILDAVETELALLGRAVPILVKVSPDLEDDDLDQLADMALRRKVAGIVAVNTTMRRDGLVSDLGGLPDGGGVSGRPLKVPALNVLRRLYRRVGREVVLISVGGIEDASDVWARVRAGATLVQGHTGFVYGGPLWPKRVNDELARRARAAGVETIQALVGAELDEAGAAPVVTAT